ncbi:MAG: DUF2169 domain-containing protein, partial [Byssovorax sp.]
MSSRTLAPDAVTSAAGAAAAALAWRLEGQLHVTVVVKSTFAFAQNAAMARVEPQPILRSEVHHGKHPTRSVQFTSDLAPYLAQADVLFTGHACVRAGAIVQAQLVRLQIFDGAGTQPLLNKALLVQDPKGFDRMPLVYERAFGGLGSQDNPLGTGAAPGSPEPNIVTPGDPRRVASFAPIGRIWPARKRLLGTTPRSALDGDIVELPGTFDWAYYQAAPPDQRIDFLRGDEWILLEGVHPTLPRVQMQLPRARGVAWLYGLSASGIPEGHELILDADTLRIDGDEQRCTVVWRAAISLPSEEALQSLRIMAAVQIDGEQLSWIDPGATPTPARGAERYEPSTGTVTLDAEPQRKRALPFGATMAVSTGRYERAATLPFMSAYRPSPPAPPTLLLAHDPDDSSVTLAISPAADEVTRERSALSLGAAGGAPSPRSASKPEPLAAPEQAAPEQEAAAPTPAPPAVARNVPGSLPVAAPESPPAALAAPVRPSAALWAPQPEAPAPLPPS